MPNEVQANRSVLIVDSDRGTWDCCWRLLAPLGYQVDWATTGQEAWTKASCRSFGVVLLEIALPDVDGVDLLRQLQDTDPRPVCIVVTARATVEVAVQVMRLGAFDLIEKPAPEGRLLEAIQGGLEQRHPVHSLALYGSTGVSAEMVKERARLKELEEANVAYLRKVAHELRAPLAAIRSILTLILQGYTTPEKAREMQERAAARADELLALISDVLGLARLKDSRFPSTLQNVSVEDALKDVLQLHTPEAKAKAVRLKVDVRPCDTTVADPTHIKQLWTNLISNAIKYTPRGGRVDVRLYPERGAVVGVVKDTGIGISSEDLPHLFEEFFRTEQAKAFTHFGTGLGLSIVKQIVQQYGGDICVESQLGKGTQFTFRLPAGSMSPH